MQTKNIILLVAAGFIALTTAYSQGWITLNQDAEPMVDPNQSPPPERSTVTKILDPITIQLESGHTIRYIGVRTPNVQEKVECFGKEALLANESILGKEVRLEVEPLLDRSADGAWTRYVFFASEENNSDEQASIPEEVTEEPVPAEELAPNIANVTDTAKEILTQDTVPSESEEASPSPEASSTPEAPKEIFVNERILEGGFGFPVVSQDMIYGERMLSAAKFSSATGKGLWGRCEVSNDGLLLTQEIDTCVIKGKISSDGTKLYRSQECPAYEQTMVIQSEGGQWFCAEDIAQDAGFSKAPDCP